jgi:hypothetical protein
VAVVPVARLVRVDLAKTKAMVESVAVLGVVDREIAAGTAVKPTASGFRVPPRRQYYETWLMGFMREVGVLGVMAVMVVTGVMGKQPMASA